MKIMFEGRYSPEAWAGVNESAQARMTATAQLAASVGGTMEEMYWCPGDEFDFVLIVSGLEFLKASWIGQSSAVEQFASRMETWDRQPALVFVLQHDGALATRPFRRFRQYTFVVDQRETLAL